ncbi:hypothetical protein J6590_002596 [Homalodisca vitripennis]|nr:hypothetical protein J6590_002596 [Homalodisca vitripennis]
MGVMVLTGNIGSGKKWPRPEYQSGERETASCPWRRDLDSGRQTDTGVIGHVICGVSDVQIPLGQRSHCLVNTGGQKDIPYYLIHALLTLSRVVDKQVYFAYAHSHLSYGTIYWGNFPASKKLSKRKWKHFLQNLLYVKANQEKFCNNNHHHSHFTRNSQLLQYPIHNTKFLESADDNTGHAQGHNVFASAVVFDRRVYHVASLYRLRSFHSRTSDVTDRIFDESGSDAGSAQTGCVRSRTDVKVGSDFCSSVSAFVIVDITSKYRSVSRWPKQNTHL